MIFQSTKRAANRVSLCLGALCAAALAQNAFAQTDPLKAYSTIGLATGETMRLDVVNVGGTNGFPPGPCNVQMGFINAAGVLLKVSNSTVQDGHAAFITLTFAEATASTAAPPDRVNIRPALNTSAIPPGPCRMVSSAEVFDAVQGRTHLYAVPTECPPGPPDSPGACPPGPPISPVFGITALTTLDALRFNVTNITGSNGFPPDPCNVQMGFVNGAGDTVKTIAGTIDAGHTAFVTVDYAEAAAIVGSTNAARLNVGPVVSLPPGPCRVSASAELLDATTGETRVYIAPAVPGDFTPPSTNGQ